MRPNGRALEEERQNETQQVALVPREGSVLTHPQSTDLDDDGEKPRNDKITIFETFLLSLQHFMVAASRCILAVLHISPVLCVLQHDPIRGLLLARLLALSGFTTLLQTSPLGIGLPLAYAPCLPTLVALSHTMSFRIEECPVKTLDDMEVYQRGVFLGPHLGRIQGALLITSLLSAVAALTARFIPVPSHPVIAAAASLVGALMLIKPPADLLSLSAAGWPAALSVITVSTVTAMISIRKTRLPLPLPACSARRGFHFHCLPTAATTVFLTAMAVWIVCAVGSATNLIAETSSLSTSSDRPDRMLGPTTFLVPSICWGEPWLDLPTILAALKGFAVGLLLTWSSWAAVSAGIQTQDPNGKVAGSWKGFLMCGVSAIMAGVIGAPAPMAGGADTAGVAFFAKVAGKRAAGLIPLRICGVLLILVSLVPSVSVVVCSTPVPALMGASLLFIVSSGGAGFLYLEEVNLRGFKPRLSIGIALLVTMLLHLQIWGAANFIS